MKNFLLGGVALFVLLTPIVANAKIFKCIDNKVDNINSERIIEIKDYWFFATLKDLTNTSNPIKFKIEKFTKYHITAIGKEDMGGVFSWEYFDCPPDTDNHALWAVNVSKCMQKTSINRCLIS